ncbi:EthD family reductase [Piscinibacter sp.]|uniref:EthD family reductase n=1 Tax=Piscinibacter sp. TaxID=1903157 RepID=UPI0039E5EC99
MITVHILYPNQPGGRFDMQYYCEKHMPMVKARLGAACVGFTVDAGLAGGAPGQGAPYVAIGSLKCTSVEAFSAAMGQHGAEILGDIPNYTDAQPVLQVSEVKVG